jgi:hypothetical protein
MLVIMAAGWQPCVHKREVEIPAGLRLKIGADVGSVSAELASASGMINYRY